MSTTGRFTLDPECGQFRYRDILLTRLAGLKHPLLYIILLGLLIRFSISSLQLVYDNNFWALVIRNIEAGEGLYGVRGYFYTPVWGYVLGFVSGVQSIFLDIGLDVERVPELFFAEAITWPKFCATVPSILFSFTVKAPLIVADLVLAYLVRAMVMDSTGDEGKGNLAFALMFLCPLLFVVSSVNAMPDVLAAMFLVMTVLLLKRDHCFLAGMTFSMAVMTKFFPVFAFFPLVAYVLVRWRDSPSGPWGRLAMSIAGAAMMTLVIFVPQIMDGTLDQCFQFLSDRTGGSGEGSILDWIIGRARLVVYSAVILVSMYMGYRMYRDCSDVDSGLMNSCFIVTASCMLYPPTSQYLLVMLPFLVYHITVRDWRQIWSLNVISLFGSLMAMGSTVLTLLPLAVWTDIIDVGTVASLFESFVQGSMPMSTVWAVVTGTLTYVGVLMVFGIILYDLHRRGRGDGTIA